MFFDFFRSGSFSELYRQRNVAWPMQWLLLLGFGMGGMGCEKDLIRVRIEHEPSFISNEILREARTLVLKPEFSTTTFDETVISVDGEELVLANPVISLVPFPLNDDRYQRWLILKNEQGEELSRGWLDAGKSQDNFVVLSTTCDDETDCRQNDGDFCNGVGKCGTKNICVVEDGCGLPSCVEVTSCSTEEGSGGARGVCTGVPIHSRCTSVRNSTETAYCNIETGCDFGKVGCTYDDVLDDEAEGLDVCGKCSICLPGGVCADVNRAPHLAPHNSCEEVSCSENEEGALEEEFVSLVDGTYCSFNDDNPELATGICRNGNCVSAGCGNGLVEAGEDCDVIRVEGDTEERSAECRINCTIPYCGDGIVDVGALEVDGNFMEYNEECDEGNAGPDDPRARRCLPDCTWNRCGDANILASGLPQDEPCDDGNSNTNDGCYIQYCGVETGTCVVDLEDRTLCDSPFSENTDCFLKTCVAAICGDGIVNRDENSGEECDDANDNPNDGCDSCRIREWQESVVIGYGQARGNALEWELSSMPVSLAVDYNSDLLVSSPAESIVTRIHLPKDLGSDEFCGRVSGGADAAFGEEKPKISWILGKTLGDSGDHGLAVDALVISPFSVDDDGRGNLVIVDRNSNKLRMITDGIISTLAGNGTIGGGNALDGGVNGSEVVALASSLDVPTQADFDGLGNVYFTEVGPPGRIRMVQEESGLITEIVGGRDNTLGSIETLEPLKVGGSVSPFENNGISLVRAVQNSIDDVVLFNSGYGVEIGVVQPINTEFASQGAFGYGRIYVVLHPGQDNAQVFAMGVEKPSLDADSALRYEEDVNFVPPGAVSYQNQGEGLENTRNLLFFSSGLISADLNGTIFVTECQRNRISRIDIDPSIVDLKERYRKVKVTRILGPENDYPQACGVGTLPINEVLENGVEGPGNPFVPFRNIEGEALLDVASHESADLREIDRPYSLVVDPIRDRLYYFEQGGRVQFSRKDGSCRISIMGRTDSESSEAKLSLLASKRYPGGIGINPSGIINNVFFAYASPVTNNAIVVHTNGQYTIAGSGEPGNTQPDATGLLGGIEEVDLNLPRSLVMNYKGDLFLSEQGNHRILKIPWSVEGYKEIEVLAGSGLEGFESTGTPFQWKFSAPSGISLQFATCSSDDDCAEGSHTCRPNGRCTSAFGSPSPVKGDALLVADQGNHVIRKIELHPVAGGAMTTRTIIGTGIADSTHQIFTEGTTIDINAPIGVVAVDISKLGVDNVENLPFSSVIIVVDRNNHTLLVFADFGPFGLLLVANIGVPGVEGKANGTFSFEVDETGAPVLDENGEPLARALFSYPRGVSFEPLSGDIVVTDGVDRLRRLAITKFPTTTSERLEGRVTTISEGSLSTDDGTSVATDDNPLDSTTTNNALLSRPRQMIALPGSQETHFLIADGAKGRIRLWENPPLTCGVGAPELFSAIGFPEGPAATLPETDDGKPARLVSYLGDASGITAFANGDLVIADSVLGELYYVSTYGGLRGAASADGCIQSRCQPGETFIPEGQSFRCEPWRIQPLLMEAGALSSPGQLASISNDDGTPAILFVVDEAQHTVRSFAVDSEQKILTGGEVVLGVPAQQGVRVDEDFPMNTQLNSPKGILLEPTSPSLRGPLRLDEVKGLFIADTGNHRVLHVEANDTRLFSLDEVVDGVTQFPSHVSIVMGIGVRAEAEAGYPTCSLPIANPTGMSFDPRGNLFVVGDGVVGVVAPDLLPASEAPSGCTGSSAFGRGTLSNVFPKDGNRYPASATQCLSAVFATSADLVFALDGCQGIALQLDAR